MYTQVSFEQFQLNLTGLYIFFSWLAWGKNLFNKLILGENDLFLDKKYENPCLWNHIKRLFIWNLFQTLMKKKQNRLFV